MARPSALAATFSLTRTGARHGAARHRQHMGTARHAGGNSVAFQGPLPNNCFAGAKACANSRASNSFNDVVSTRDKHHSTKDNNAISGYPAALAFLLGLGPVFLIKQNHTVLADWHRRPEFDQLLY